MNLQPGFVPMFRPVAVPYVSVAMPIHPGMPHPPPGGPGQTHFFPGASIAPPPAPPPTSKAQGTSPHALQAGLLSLGSSQPGVQPGSVSLVNAQSMQHQNHLMSIGLLGQAPQMTQAAALQSQGLLAGLPQAGASISPGTALGQLQHYQVGRLPFPDEAHRAALNSLTSQVAGKLEESLNNEPQDGGMAMLDHFNSDLNLQIDEDGYGGKAMTNPPGFCFCWAGARSTYGVCKGKVYYEVHISEYLPVDFPSDHQETNPHVVRVGWSIDSASMQLGEEPWSYGYGGTGKFSTNSKFSNYGEKFMAGDVIGTLLDLESHPPTISYTKNGQWLGVAVPIHNYPVGQPNMALFPHILSKNCGFKINFGQMAPWYPPPQGYLYVDQLPFSCKVHGMEPPQKKSDCEMIMIIGLPGAGKTTWGINMQKGYPDKRYNIIGTDTLIDKMRVMGLPRRRNYHGRWDTLIDKATKCLNTLFQIASKRNRNYILDQTNVYPSAQRRKMGYFQGFYRKAAILVPEDSELIRRSIKRTEEDGKHVPEEAVLEMKKNFQVPDPNSSLFDEINFVEMPRDAAVGLIAQYNDEGREKLPNKNRTFDRFNQQKPPGGSQPNQYGRGGPPGPPYQNWQGQDPTAFTRLPPPQPPPMQSHQLQAEWQKLQENRPIKRETDSFHSDRKRQRSEQGGGSALDFIKQEYAEDEKEGIGSGAGWQGMKVKTEQGFWPQMQGNANPNQPRLASNQFSDPSYQTDNKPTGGFGRESSQQTQRIDSNYGSFNQPNQPSPQGSDSWGADRRNEGPGHRRQDTGDNRRDTGDWDNKRRDRDDFNKRGNFDIDSRRQDSGFGNKGRDEGNRGRGRDRDYRNAGFGGNDRESTFSNRGNDSSFSNRDSDSRFNSRNSDSRFNSPAADTAYGSRSDSGFGDPSNDGGFNNRGRDSNSGNYDRSTFSAGNFNKNTNPPPLQSGNWNLNSNNPGQSLDKKFSENPSPDYSQPEGSQGYFPGRNDLDQSKPPTPSNNRRHFAADNAAPASGRTRQRKSKWDTPSDSPEPSQDAPDFPPSGPSGSMPMSLLTPPPPPPPEDQVQDNDQPSWRPQQNWSNKPQPLLQMDLPNMADKFNQLENLDSKDGSPENTDSGPPPPDSFGGEQWNPNEEFSEAEEFPEMNNPGPPGPGPGPLRMRGRGFGMSRGGPRFMNRPPGNGPRFGPPRGGGPGNFGPRPPPFGNPRGGWNRPPPRGPHGFEGRGGGPRNFPPRFGGPRMGGGPPRFPRMMGHQRWPRP